MFREATMGSSPYIAEPDSPFTNFRGDLPGDYVLSLTASDGADTSLPDTLTVSVIAALPPVASADVTSGVAPFIVQLDASQSQDKIGGGLIYRWNFGDGSEDSTKMSPAHMYSEAGTFTVAPRVIDQMGQTDVDILTITVTPPSVPALGPPGIAMLLSLLGLAGYLKLLPEAVRSSGRPIKPEN